MTKRIICLLLAVMIFAALPLAGAFADGESVTETIQTETLKQFCERLAQEKKIDNLDYTFALPAIRILNHWVEGTDWGTGSAHPEITDDPITTLVAGVTSIKLPKSNKDAALIRGVELPANLATGETQDYVIKAKDTMMGICKTLGLDYGKCKAAILKLNGWNDNNLLTMKAGTKIKLPKTDADAAIIAASGTTGTGTGTGIGGILTPADGTVAAYMVPYVVKTGETIYGICQANGIDFNRYINLIMQASGITYASSIHTGDIIFLPSATASSGSVSIVTHTVKTGETVYGICQSLGLNYNASIKMITSLNPSKNLSNIRTGDVLFFPKGSIPSGGGTGGGGTSGGTGGGAGGYTPASADPPVTQKNPTAVEGAMFYFKEYTVVVDDTVYNLLKAESLAGEYFNYYANAMLAASNRGTFANLKAGEKIQLATKNAAGATIKVFGVKVKNGDTAIKLCTDNGIEYNANVNLIAKLNPSLNLNNLHVDDIVLLPLAP